MFDFLLTEEQRKIRDEARDLVRWVPRKMILDMDADQIRFPKEFLQEAGRRNLFGCRYPTKWGGRDMDWVTTCMVMEEVGTLGYIFSCVFGIGAELVCDAIILHGTDEQKEKYVKPLLAGELFAAECLTEPRGGSDFFGTTTTAVDKGDHFLLNGQKRFIVGAEGADFFLVYARTAADAEPHKALTCFIVDRSPGLDTKYVYGLMGCRGGGAARIVFKDVKVPKENIVGQLHGAYAVFNTMMIPERLGYCRHDHRRSQTRFGHCNRLHHPAKSVWPDHQPVSGREFSSGRGRHAAGCVTSDGLRHCKSGGFGSRSHRC